MAIVVYTPPARAVLLTAVLVWEVSLGSQLNRGSGGDTHTPHKYNNNNIWVQAGSGYICAYPPLGLTLEIESSGMSQSMLYI